MQECLGISVSDKIIKYAKIQSDNNRFKIVSYGVNFYDKIELNSTIKKIVAETNSDKVPIAIDLNTTKYYFFDVFGMTNKQYLDQAINTEFESFCSENHMNRNSYEGRYVYTKNLDTPDKNKVLYLYENKGDLEERFKIFGDARVSTAVPLTAAYPSIVRTDAAKNSLIVDLNEKTTITAIVNGQMYGVDVLGQGLEEVFSKINVQENDYQKTYDICKNITIYTAETADVNAQGNPQNTTYLTYLVPALYKIAQELQKVVDNYKGITNIYLTGLGTVINNVDLYFQEYFKDQRVEILRPYFATAEADAANIKDIIEVNSAIALATFALKNDNKDLNFKNQAVDKWARIKEVLTSDVSSLGSGKKEGGGKKNFQMPKVEFSMDMRGAFDKWDTILLGFVIDLILIVVLYCVGAGLLQSAIKSKTAETEEMIADTKTQITAVTSDNAKVTDKTKDYIRFKENLEEVNSSIEQKRSRKHQITTLLNNIVYVIPKQVKLTEIKNTVVVDNGTTKQHIFIEAQSEKYEQLAYFKAKLSNANIMDNIVSTEGTKDGEVVKTTIEGDLKEYN